MEPETLLLIAGPRAARARERGELFDAAAVLSAAGYLVSIYRAKAPGDAARAAAREGPRFQLVAAAGDDRTLHEVISGLAGLERPPALGYIARGNAGAFASSLGLPGLPAPVSASVIARKRARKVDLGYWNGRAFLYAAVFGGLARGAYAAPPTGTGLLDGVTQVLENVKDLAALRPYRLRITAGGETLEGEYLFGAVCNAAPLDGPLKLGADRVTMDDGLFELLLVPSPRSAADLQGLVMALLDQRYDGMVFRRTPFLRLETGEELPWFLDGEAVPGAPEVEIVNSRRALTMLL